MPVNHFPSGFRSVYLFVCILITLSACQQSEIKQEPVQPNEFVSVYTSGQISSRSPVRIVFNLPEEVSNVSSRDVEQGVFRLNPSVEGKTYWADQSTLIFDPDKPLPDGKNYEAIVDLKKLLGVEDEQLQTFKFYFEVIQLSFSVEIDGFRPYTNLNSEWISVKGSVSTSDEIEYEVLPSLMTANQDGKPLQITYQKRGSRDKYNFIIDSINRVSEKTALTIKWKSDEEVHGFGENNEMRYSVPSMDKLEFLRAVSSEEGDQFVKLEFSDPLDINQEMNGLVYFVDGTPVRLSVSQNTVYMYPSSPFTGNKNIVIKKEIRSGNKKSLANDVLLDIFFGREKPAIRFTSSGTIMPGTEGWFLPFEAIGLDAVDVLITEIHTSNVKQFFQVNRLSGDYQLRRVGTLVHHQKISLAENDDPGLSQWVPYAIDLSKMINKHPGAIYKVDLRFRKSYSVYDCDGNNQEEDESLTTDDDYFTSDYYYPDGYKWSEREDPCHISYYNYVRFVSKNVLATNLGVIIKEDGDRFLVYTNDLVTTNPVSGAKISMFNYQLQELASANSNTNGVASIEYTGDPYLIVAEKDGQFTYQRVDGGSALSYSKFQTSGVNIEKGIKGFIYGERGVWRPGDSIFLSVIVDDRDNPLPKGHPVRIKLTNPNGKLVAQKTSVKGVNNFYTFKLHTSEDAPTGFWKATAEVGGAVFSKTIRIETIKPNRLKIDLDFEKALLTSGISNAKLNVKWLHGGVAASLKADVNITIRPTKTFFENFESFNFDDPARYFSPEDLTIFNGKLNSKGRKSFIFELPPVNFAPGMLKVNFATKVYEQGGDFSIHQTSRNYTQYDRFIGISGPDGKSDYLEVDVEQEFEVASVSAKGNPISVDSLDVEIYKLDWSWWYSSNSRNLASYISSNYNRKILSKIVSTSDGKGSFTLKLNYPEWGWYYVRVSDPEGGHQTGMKVYLDWPSWYSRENRKAPGSMSLLSLSADKEKYEIGEEIRISVPTPANASLLVALEKGDRQLKSWQMKATGEETLITFKATPEMTPNMYVYVSVLQPHAQTVNDLPIRMYGVLPVFVEDANTVLSPGIELPKSVRPGETYNLKVSEANKKSMTYTVAIVDDGLLDLTNYRTPDPHKYFYAKEALAVRSWDMYNDVMGAFGGRLEKVFSIGGDMELEGEVDKKKENRFKPVVDFLGPFHLAEGKTNGHQVAMPNYIGSVRVMVIAGEKGAYGNAQKTMTVKQPLMVLGTLPRVLAPGESVKLPVSVFVMDENLKEVQVNLETNGFISSEINSKKLTISEMGEHMTFFDLKVDQKQGIAKVTITVKSRNEVAKYDVALEVRNPNPREFHSTHHVVKSSEKLDVNPKLIGLEGTNEIVMTVSGMPSLNLEKRLKYLIHYPYGCVEQTTSSVFPQLYLDKLVDLDDKMKSRIEKNIREGINRLNKFQLTSGGFSYWQGSGSSADWGTSYAGHFLLLAKEKGYHVSASMINSWVRFQKQASNSWIYQSSNELNQAYRLYTLALAGEPNLSAMNRLRENKTLSTSAKFRLGAAYALIGQNDVAKKLIENETYQPEKTKSYWRWNYGSVTRDQAMILETYLLLDDINSAMPIFMRISESLKSNKWMSTQTTAFALYAASLFTDDQHSDEEYSFTYSWNNEKSSEIRSKSPIFTIDLIPKTYNKLEFENQAGNNLFVTISSSGISELDKIMDYQKNFGMELNYFDMNGDTINIANIKHGTDFYAKVVVNNPSKNGDLENVALSQLFPSGWEVINTRMLDVGASLRSDVSDYVDFRDDRVNTFFSIRGGQSKRFVVLLNAAYQGRFYLPASTTGPMYDHEISAGKGGGWIQVSK